MKTTLINMRMEVTVEDGDKVDENVIYKGPPIKFVKNLAKHEWKKIVKEDEE